MARKRTTIRRDVQSKILIPPQAPPTSGLGPSLPNVGYQRVEFGKMLDDWRKIEDCLSGQKAIKAKREVYLPMPSVDSRDEEQRRRYDTYLQRAIFYNVAARTLDGMMGQVFSRDPLRKLPPALEAVAEDIDGEGVSLDQQAKKALGYTMAFGRAGIFTDYPDVGRPVTVLEQKLGLYRPTITLVHPMSIINWRTKLVGGKAMLSLVVIQENVLSQDDGFEVSFVQQWRVLQLNAEGNYQVERWRRETQEEIYYSYSKHVPTDGNGNPFKEIPFQFIGPLDNNADIDHPPLLDLCEVNIGHYRNSADYEEMAFVAGQPTAFFAGLTKDWVEDVFKDFKVHLGSRAIIPLPQGATAGILQITPNSVPFEAMTHKESQMVAMGANLLVKSGGNRTFGEAQQEEASEQSILSACTKNVSMAFRKALRWANQFQTGVVNDEEIQYDLNTDFPASRLTPNERAELILEWQQGAITFKEMRAGLRRAGVASEDDAKAETEGKATVKFIAETAAAGKVGDAASGGTNKAKLNNGNGGGNQAGN